MYPFNSLPNEIDAKRNLGRAGHHCHVAITSVPDRNYNLVAEVPESVDLSIAK